MQLPLLQHGQVVVTISYCIDIIGNTMQSAAIGIIADPLPIPCRVISQNVDMVQTVLNVSADGARNVRTAATSDAGPVKLIGTSQLDG